jgi:hypothetical protein
MNKKAIFPRDLRLIIKSNVSTRSEINRQGRGCERARVERLRWNVKGGKWVTTESNFPLCGKGRVGAWERGTERGRERENYLNMVQEKIKRLHLQGMHGLLHLIHPQLVCAAVVDILQEVIIVSIHIIVHSYGIFVSVMDQPRQEGLSANVLPAEVERRRMVLAFNVSAHSSVGVT